MLNWTSYGFISTMTFFLPSVDLCSSSRVAMGLFAVQTASLGGRSCLVSYFLRMMDSIERCLTLGQLSPALNFSTAVFLGLHDAACSPMFCNKPLGRSENSWIHREMK
ncbi:hypothetical protein XENORESO_016711 [Xenotaenia resolanae]|uniref:Secreted protein n=1 Tax=Xenotaenia resolanae TaxID=208358 RepID=A0ABV0W6D4_9TELE